MPIKQCMGENGTCLEHLPFHPGRRSYGKAMKPVRFFVVNLAAWFGLVFPQAVLKGQPLTIPAVYTLVEGSTLVDDCPVCDRLPITVPLQGTFRLRFLNQDPLFDHYAVEDISFTAGSPNGPQYTIVGRGSYRIGGEVGLVQDLSLRVTIDNGMTNPVCYLTNGLTQVTRRWPMFQVGIDQTNGTLTQQFHLDINAAPFREIWFSTAQPFNASGWNPPTNTISPGDLLSSIGRVVKRNLELTGRLGVQPATDLGLKAVDVLPGAEVAFSIERPAFSQSLGSLEPGDLLSDQGHILRTNPQLLAAFAPSAPVQAGLDAVQVLESGEIFFSIQTNVFSTALGRMLSRGDLLSDTGALVKSNAELIAAFKPLNTKLDVGLKSVYVWPSGEVWFSTEEGFASGANSNYCAPGDVLSDQGYVVYRNRQLLSSWNGPSDTNNFGLDALYVVSDVTPPASTAGKTRLATPQITTTSPTLAVLSWTRGGRVFQLEKAADPGGPYEALSPIFTDGSYADEAGPTNILKSFYRVRQW